MGLGLVAVCTNSDILRVGVGTMVAGFDAVDDVVAGCDIFEIITLHPSLRVMIVDGGTHQEHLIEFLGSRNSDEDHVAEFLLITATCRQRELVESLRRGARGIVTSGCGADDLQLALEVVSRGSCYIQRTLCDQLAGALVAAYQIPMGLEESLTSRESEVFELLCTGMSNNAIAVELHVTIRTVKYHVSNVLDKLGANNRSEAIAIVLQAERGDSTATRDRSYPL